MVTLWPTRLVPPPAQRPDWRRVTSAADDITRAEIAARRQMLLDQFAAETREEEEASDENQPAPIL